VNFKYRHFRIALMTFALGFSAVSFVRTVQLPSEESIDVIIVNPAYECGRVLNSGGSNVLFECGGGGGASGVDSSSALISINDRP